MAKNDIRIWRAPKELNIGWYPVAASSTFVAGEPVRLNTGGELVEATTDWATGEDFLGIAMASGDTVGATDANGTFRSLVGAFTPGTGLPVSADLVPVVLPSPDVWFVTSNFDLTTGAFGDAPVKTSVGDAGGLALVSGTWGYAAGGTKNARVMHVLDSNLTDIAFSGNAGVSVVIVFGSGQTMADAVITDADA